MTWARRGLTVLLAAFAVVMLGPAYSWAVPTVYQVESACTGGNGGGATPYRTTSGTQTTISCAVSGSGALRLTLSSTADATDTRSNGVSWNGVAHGTWTAPGLTASTYVLDVTGPGTLTVTQVSGNGIRFDAYSVDTVPEPSPSPSPEPPLPAPSPSPSELVTPSPSPTAASPEPSPSAQPGTTTPPQDLVCEQQGCVMRLDGTQYLVVMTALGLIVMLLVTNLVRSEAVPILRG